MIIKVENLMKSFGDNLVLKDVSFEVNEGEVICIIGPSGSGKSTLLRCLNRLEEAEGGAVIVFDTDVMHVEKINEFRQRIGMVFQMFNLFPNYTVIENIVMAPVELGIMNRAKAIDKALSLLEMVGLADKKNVYPDTLSGGQKQRLSIARAVLKNPPIMILDEATSALDTESEKFVQVALENMMQNRTSIVIAHRLSTIQKADVIVVMKKGFLRGFFLKKVVLMLLRWFVFFIDKNSIK